MLRPGTQDSYISRKVNMPTDLGHGALVSQVPANIKAQAFFSARVAEARILERLRSVSDQYSRGEIGLGEARNALKDFLKAEGYNPHKAGLKNLASTARLNLILKQNAAMAHAAGEWKRMHDPDAMKVFPYVRYHSRGDSRSRFSHSQLDGKIFHKDDPFLKTHTPPWEFNCRCWLEEITAKEAGRHEEDIQERTPPDQVKVESQSGFSFDPEHVFEEFDLSSIKDAGLRKKTEIGIKKILGQVQQPGANDVGKQINGKPSTVGVNMQDSQPYPDDNAHKKLKPVFNAIRKSEDEFIQCITPKGNGKKNQEFIGIYDQNGKPYWVGMGPKGKGAANFPEIPEGCTLIHNHPGGSPFSMQDIKEFIERKMSRMVVSVQHEDGKTGKFTLTKKNSGDTLSPREIEQRFDNAVQRTDNKYEAWKEALNGTCYEIRDS